MRQIKIIKALEIEKKSSRAVINPICKYYTGTSGIQVAQL